MADVIMPDKKDWNLPLISSLFEHNSVLKIVKTPLYNSVTADNRIWHKEKDGLYSVKSAYRLCVHEELDTSHLKMSGNWNLIWKLKAPPCVKNLLWRICRQCTPTRTNLHHRGVNCTTVCALCNEYEDDSRHIFFDCLSSKNIWNMCNFNDVITAGLQHYIDATELDFALLQQLNVDEAALMACVVWSIWKQRNIRILNDVTDAHSAFYSRAINTLTDWRAVQIMKGGTRETQRSMEHKWKKPTIGRVKCNIDASFSPNLNQVGMGVYIRDEFGVFRLAKYDQYSPICDVRIGEALGLLSALKWVHGLNLGSVDFELDSKLVVDSFRSNKQVVSEFGDIIAHCRRLFSLFYNNFNVEFIRRQANEFAHRLYKAATYVASPQILVNIPHCIEHLLMNEML